MRTLDIGIDLDGVCYDFTASLRHYLIEHEDYDPHQLRSGGVSDHDTTWNFYKDCWGMTTEEFLAVCERGVDAGVVFGHGEPFEGTVETLEEFRSDGHRLHIITNRSFGTRSHHNTSEWLERHKVPFDSLVFSTHKTIIRPDVMVDDYPDNQRAFIEAGVPCFLYTRPWNVNANDYGSRVGSWAEFTKVVQQMATEE
jgi:FMN phosphatase YigB (HAD superfamily)